MKNKKNNNLNFPDHQIDILILTKILWREKILILFICALGILISFMHNYNSIKFSETRANLQATDTDFFSIYEYELNKKQLDRDFKNNFIGLLKSNYNFIDYINQNQNISKGYNFSDFIFDFLQVENTPFKKYNFENENDFQNVTKYFELRLIFKNGINGKDFLDNYLNYSFEKLKQKFKENLKLSLTNKILMYRRNLDIALKIDLSDPIVIENKSSSLRYIESQDIFFQGVKVLEQKILSLNLMIENLDDDFDKISPIFSEASFSSPAPNRNNISLFYGFIVSFFLSLIVVFVKNILKFK
jgi:capsular polysaccharide biosynthesis protein